MSHIAVAVGTALVAAALELLVHPGAWRSPARPLAYGRRAVPPPAPIPDLTPDALRSRLGSQGLVCDDRSAATGAISWFCRGQAPEGHLSVIVLGAVNGPELVVIHLSQRQADDGAAAVRLGEVASCVFTAEDSTAVRRWIAANVSAGGQTMIGRTEVKISGLPRSRVLDIRAPASRYSMSADPRARRAHAGRSLIRAESGVTRVALP